MDGRLFTTLKGDKIVAEFIQILDDYVESHYAPKEELAAKNVGIINEHVGTATSVVQRQAFPLLFCSTKNQSSFARLDSRGGCPHAGLGSAAVPAAVRRALLQT